MRNEINERSIINEHENELMATMSTLTHAIITTKLKFGKNDFEDFFKKIALHTILYYSLGEPKRSEVSILLVHCVWAWTLSIFSAKVITFNDSTIIWYENKVIEETVDALKSIMEQRELVKFTSIDDEDEKLDVLRGIENIVCGIRLFNKDTGHCASGIVNSE